MNIKDNKGLLHTYKYYHKILKAKQTDVYIYTNTAKQVRVGFVH